MLGKIADRMRAKGTSTPADVVEIARLRRGFRRRTGFVALLLGVSATACSLVVGLDGLSDGPAATAKDDASSVDAGRDAIADTADAMTSSERYRAAVLGDGPALYYRFDDAPGTAIANDGPGGAGLVVNSTVTFGLEGAFDGSKAVAFDAGGAAISAGQILDFDGREPFTFEFWYRPDPSSASAYCAFFGKGLSNDAGRQSYAMWVHRTEGLAFERYVDGTSVRAAVANLKADDYYHLATTYDGSTLTVYVNGAALTSMPDTRSGTSTDAPLLVGGSFSSSCLRATMDEFAVYEKALGPEQLKAHYLASGRR